MQLFQKTTENIKKERKALMKVSVNSSCDNSDPTTNVSLKMYSVSIIM